jgi:predicted Zn-dependent protease
MGDDVAGLTDDEERLLGERIHQSLRKTLKIDHDSSTHDRVKRLLAPLLDDRSPDASDIQFTIVDSPEVNAFSHAGGYLYIHRGLIDLGLSDGELQFVIGHELAHVDLGHCARGMSYAHRADEVLGHAASVVVGHAYKAVALGYSEEQEFAADAWAWEATHRLGVPDNAAATCLQKIDLEATHDKSRKASSRPQTTQEPGNLITSLEDHFASHPRTDQRVARLDALAARKPAPILSR